MSTPLISIIIPVYNNEKLLRDAVHSVIHGQFKDFELIIVDDGSTDNTPKIADAFATEDLRVRVIHHSQNRWIYAAFNTGLAAAIGEYVTFLMSDDSYCDNALENMANFISCNKVDLLLMQLSVYYKDNLGKATAAPISPHIKRDMVIQGSINVRKNWAFFLRNNLLDNPTKLYKTSIAKQFSFRNDWYAADSFYNIAVADSINSIGLLSRPVYNHNIYIGAGNRLNASVNKFYSYETKMLSEMYHQNRRLFESWNLFDNSIKDLLAARRLFSFSYSLRIFSTPQFTLPLKERLKLTMQRVDEELVNIASDADKTEELEARILCTCKDILMCFAENEPCGEYEFVREILTVLLRYEKEPDDDKRLCAAVKNSNNVFGIGLSLLKYLQIKEP